MSQLPSGRCIPRCTGPGVGENRLNCCPCKIAYHAEGLEVLAHLVLTTFVDGMENSPQCYFHCAQYLLLAQIQKIAQSPYAPEDQAKIRELRTMSATLMMYFMRTFP